MFPNNRDMHKNIEISAWNRENSFTKLSTWKSAKHKIKVKTNKEINLSDLSSS